MSINFGSVNTSALAEYFVKKYNLAGRDAEYSKNRWTLGQIPRDTERLKQGDGFYETVKIAGGRSGSVDFELGNKYHKPSDRMRWAVTDPYAQYGFVSFDTLALQRNGLGTVLDIKGAEADDVKEGMLNDCEFDIWAGDDHALGQVSASGLGGSATVRVCTLATASDVYNFERNMLVTSNTSADGSGTAHSNVYEVTALDPIGGKVTLTRVVDNSSALAASDYLVQVGSTVGGTDNRMPGIPKFIPSSDPSDTLLGVTRTSDPVTSGWRFSFKASIAETIQRAFATMGRYVNKGAGRYVVCLSTMDWLLLSMEREGRAAPSTIQGTEKWGLSALAVTTPHGVIECVAVPQLKDGRGYILDFSTWKLYTLRNLPHVIDEDGQMFVRGGVGTVSGNEHINGDFIKMQFRLWKVLLCLKPLSNATFPTRAS